MELWVLIFSFINNFSSQQSNIINLFFQSCKYIISRINYDFGISWVFGHYLKVIKANLSFSRLYPRNSWFRFQHCVWWRWEWFYFCWVLLCKMWFFWFSSYLHTSWRMWGDFDFDYCDFALYENGIKIGNASALSIRNTIINGDAIMLTSFTNDRPTLKDCFKYNSDVESHWQGISNVILTPQTLNITQIYISIFGNA